MENNTYTRQFSEEEIKLVEHFVIDFNQWIEDAINGKIESCRKKIMRDEFDRRISSGQDLPQKPIDFISAVFSDPNYLNRKSREENDKSTPASI